MQFRDLKKQYEVLKSQMDQSISEVLTSTNFISGIQVKELEAGLAEYVGTKHCITCANGTDALTMVLMAWGIQKGDAVFVPDFTFFASGEVVSLQGATPVFVDVDRDTFNIDAEKLEAAVQSVIAEGKLTPRVVIAVDLFGLPADYEKIREVSGKYQLKILEDGAQGFGGSIAGQRACSFGDAATTSFFPAKPLGCYGDGGAIFTNEDAMEAFLRSIRVHGKGAFKYDNIRIGLNSRLDTIQAAILKVKFDAFQNGELAAVNKAAAVYDQELASFVKTPSVPEHMYSSWAQYTIQLESQIQRDGLQEYLKSCDIPSMVYYPKAMHEQQAYAGLHHYQEFPVTELLCKTVLSLPMHPYLREEEICLICRKIKEFLTK